MYDGRRDNAWRVTHASMYPDPDLGEYDIGGEKFTLMDGVVGLAHSPAQGLLYYQPLATDRYVRLVNEFHCLITPGYQDK